MNKYNYLIHYFTNIDFKILKKRLYGIIQIIKIKCETIVVSKFLSLIFKTGNSNKMKIIRSLLHLSIASRNAGDIMKNKPQILFFESIVPVAPIKILNMDIPINTLLESENPI